MDKLGDGDALSPINYTSSLKLGGKTKLNSVPRTGHGCKYLNHVSWFELVW